MGQPAKQTGCRRRAPDTISRPYLLSERFIVQPWQDVQENDGRENDGTTSAKTRRRQVKGKFKICEPKRLLSAGLPRRFRAQPLPALDSLQTLPRAHSP